MFLTSGHNKNTFLNDLKKNLKDSSVAYISTAYVSLSGIKEITDELYKLDKVFMIVGDMTMGVCQEFYYALYRDEPITFKEKSVVLRLREMVKNKRLNIIFYEDESEAKIIHSKVYLLAKRDGSYKGYVGSANLTYPGFYTNKETVVSFTDYTTVNGCYRDFLGEWFRILGKPEKEIPDIDKESFKHKK